MGRYTVCHVRDKQPDDKFPDILSGLAMDRSCLYIFKSSALTCNMHRGLHT